MEHVFLADRNFILGCIGKACHDLCYFCLVLLCFRVRLFINALSSPAGKGLTSWLSFVMSNCERVTFSLVSWVRCVT